MGSDQNVRRLIDRRSLNHQSKRIQLSRKRERNLFTSRKEERKKEEKRPPERRLIIPLSGLKRINNFGTRKTSPNCNVPMKLTPI